MRHDKTSEDMIKALSQIIEIAAPSPAVTIDEWLLKRKYFDFDESLDAIKAILDALIKNPTNKPSTTTIFRQEIRQDDKSYYEYSISDVADGYQIEEDEKASKVRDLSHIFLQILLPNSKGKNTKELIKVLYEDFHYSWHNHLLTIPDYFNIELQESLLDLLKRMSESNSDSCLPLEYIQNFFHDIKNHRNRYENPLPSNHASNPLDGNYKRLLSQFDMAKFNGTNSDGIQKIQAIVNNFHTDTIDKIDGIRAIAVHKTNGTLSNWIKRHSFFGKGRHENIEKFYQFLAKIPAKKDMNEKKLNDILSEIEQFFKDNTSFVFDSKPSKNTHRIV